jgi:hypothetical protein
MRITPPYSAPPKAAPRRAGRLAGGFTVGEPEAPGLEVPESQPAAPAPALADVHLAALQAALPGHSEASSRQVDQQAGRHGRAMLGALAGLQLAGLGGDTVAARRTLADLARALPAGASPGLDAILQAIAQRAAVELARS